MSSRDQIQRFIFTDTDIRGELVHLESSFADVLATHEYPPAVQQLLGEFIAAATLLSATLKFEGLLSIQAKGSGPISSIMAECTDEQQIRAIATLADESTVDLAQPADITTLLQGGVLAITIDPAKGQRYQSMVPLNGATLATCLDSYFAQSEQLPSRFWLACHQQRAAGMLLQILPGDASATHPDSADWQHITTLAETLTTEELTDLDNQDLLYRLFHQEQVQLYPTSPVRFECSCSRERSITALCSLGQIEVARLFTEQEAVTIDCQFCHQTYHFSERDLPELFPEQPSQLH